MKIILLNCKVRSHQGLRADSGGQHSGETPRARFFKPTQVRRISRSELRPQNL